MQDIKFLEAQLAKHGYLDIAIDPSLDLFEEINKLKKEKNAVILAHYYQDSDIHYKHIDYSEDQE